MTKRPSKDDFQLKERSKIESEVFDRFTLLNLSKLIKKEIIATVDYPISTGKEANVFRGTTPSGQFIAIKIYKVDTAPFFRKEEYLEGDPRFGKLKQNPRDIVIAFARKEFKNLQICEKAGVHSPKPFYHLNNVIVMEFLGKDDLPYPTLNLIGSKDPKKEFKSLLVDIEKMYCAGLVHADLSEYNILLVDDTPYLIDFGQGVILAHPSANKFFERDVSVVMKYYSKYGACTLVDLEKTLNKIRKK
jgi:RIO kinase 1